MWGGSGMQGVPSRRTARGRDRRRPWGQHFEGHVARQARVAGAIDLPIPPAPKARGPDNFPFCCRAEARPRPPLTARFMPPNRHSSGNRAPSPGHNLAANRLRFVPPRRFQRGRDDLSRNRCGESDLGRCRAEARPPGVPVRGSPRYGRDGLIRHRRHCVASPNASRRISWRGWLAG